MKAGVHAYNSRRQRKREIRALWITRINAAARQNGLSYSELIHRLKKSGSDLNRKVLADIALNEPESFARLVATTA